MPDVPQRRPTLTLWGRDYPVAVLVATLGIGLGGALLARAVGTPLPWLFGSIVATAGAAILGLRVQGRTVDFPNPVRNFFVPVIGVSIGGAFSSDLLGEAATWAPSLLAILVYVPLVHWMGFTIARRAGGIDAATAWFGTMPGGFVEAIVLGEQAGASPAILTAMQFLRLILCLLLIPLGFSIWSGEAVGSAGGVRLPGADLPLGFRDAVVLAFCAVAGFFGARLVRLPAGQVTGPLLLSGIAHLGGFVAGQPPAWTLQLTQLVIGITLGVRFAGLPRGDLLRAFRLSGGIVTLTLGIVALAAIALGRFVGEPPEAVILAFAPGGVIEMSLVALSLGISTLYVTAHHVLRIALAVTIGRLGWALARRRQ
jgi:membrane AbrB-like protein